MGNIPQRMRDTQPGICSEGYEKIETTTVSDTYLNVGEIVYTVQSHNYVVDRGVLKGVTQCGFEVETLQGYYPERYQFKYCFSTLEKANAFSLKKTIDSLEDDLIEYNKTLIELNQRIKEREALIQKLKSQCETS